jgi:hypothetical protein
LGNFIYYPKFGEINVISTSTFMRFNLILTTLLLLSFICSFAQKAVYSDTVYLKDDIKIPCKILEVGYKEISIQYGDSSDTKIPSENFVDYKIADIKTFKKEKKALYRGYAKNTVFFEGFGNGLYSSINYDRIFKRKYNSAVSLRVGYSQNDVGAFIPIELNYLDAGIKPGCFAELGIGATPLVFAKTDGFASVFFLRVGFRYQQPKGGFFFRFGFLPGYSTTYSYMNERYYGVTHPCGFIPWYGISIGYTIQK